MVVDFQCVLDSNETQIPLQARNYQQNFNIYFVTSWKYARTHAWSNSKDTMQCIWLCANTVPICLYRLLLYYTHVEARMLHYMLHYHSKDLSLYSTVVSTVGAQWRHTELIPRQTPSVAPKFSHTMVGLQWENFYSRPVEECIQNTFFKCCLLPRQLRSTVSIELILLPVTQLRKPRTLSLYCHSNYN